MISVIFKFNKKEKNKRRREKEKNIQKCELYQNLGLTGGLLFLRCFVLIIIFLSKLNLFREFFKIIFFFSVSAVRC